MHTSQYILRALAATLVAGAASGQAKVWIVAELPGPGVDFTEIQAAVDAAANGDAILVKGGTYGHFGIVGKGVSVMADSGAVVYVAKFTGSHSSIGNVPAGQLVLLRGLEFYSPPYPPGALLSLSISQGEIWIEDCSVGGASQAAVRVFQCASANLVRCKLTGTGALFLPSSSPMGPSTGLTSVDSNTRLYDTTASGGGGAVGKDVFQNWVTLGGASGARVDGGTILVSGSALSGGAGGSAKIDSSTGQCVGPTDGGHGLWLAIGAPAAVLFGESLVGGAPGAGLPGCPNASPGDALHIDSGGAGGTPGMPASIEAESAEREGGTLTVFVHGAPGALAFAVGSVVASTIPTPFGDLLLGSPTFFVPLGTLPASGALALAIPITELGSGVQGIVFFLQSASCGPTPSCHLGGPSATLLLDSAF